MRANNTLLGRMLLGPAIGCVQFYRGDLRAIRAGNGAIRLAWGCTRRGWRWPSGGWLGPGAMPVWAYLLAAYLGGALLKIRTYLEHRAHEAFRARTVIIEDRGPLALLFLNNNLHVVHHMHPAVPWYDLPALYAAARPLPAPERGLCLSQLRRDLPPLPVPARKTRCRIRSGR
jgi:fatty acid desaturase